MTFFKNYYGTLLSSLTSPSSYGKRGETFWKGYRYLYILCLISSFVLFVPVAVTLFTVLPKVDDFLAATKTALSEVYPEELQVSFASGAMSTNVGTPYYIDLPPSFIQYFGADVDPHHHLIAIDPESSVEDFPSHQSFVLLTKNYFVTADRDRVDSSDPEANPLENFRVMKYPGSSETFVVTKDKYDIVVAVVESYFVYVKPMIVALIFAVLFIVPFLLALLWLSGLMLWFLFTSLIVRAVSYFMKRSLTYSTIYVYSFYAATGVVLYAIVKAFLPIPIPLVGSIILFTTLVLVLTNAPKKTS